MQRIQSITLRNFKFFYGLETEQKQNKIDLNQNNLLLYGENGSGKSSIYWALYTFLQSCLKTDVQIKKYFDPTDSQNLRNRFSSDTDDSAIILEIVDENGARTKEISNRKLETNKTTDTTVDKIIAGSDFINYKFLSKLYDFRNSEEIDLFDWLEREVLMFVDFEESYTDNQGNLSTSTLASDWWSFICEAPNSLTPNKKNKNTAKRDSPEYLALVNTTLPKFIELLKTFLTKITIKTNQYLKEDFDESFKVDFGISSIKSNYNNWIGKGNISRPIIPLKVTFDHDSLESYKKEIGKPHTFLNEARLTAIALAIRLAMLEERLYDENSASLLVLDDLLLSLDMSHRDKVLDIILKKVDEYQIFILTHDRAFYSLCKRRIENNARIDDTFKWDFKEMYQDTTDKGIPCPFIPEKKSYIDLAKKYLKEFDYPASANYIRKESERVLKYILPESRTVKIKESDDDEGSVTLNLDGLINNFTKYFRDLGGDLSPFQKFKEHKDLLMNPLSHDNISSPIYKQEILSAIKIIESLNSLELKLYESDLVNTNTFILSEIDSEGKNWAYTFYLKDNLRLIKDLNGTWLINNPHCQFISRQNTTDALPLETFPSPHNAKLNAGYTTIRHVLGIRIGEADNKKNIIDIITKDGEPLTTN
ncbi:AAA family ATPase [Christiangramia sp. OXR-203]|uniref:AAA family ATPase n=1 Tax=Christiangramia sp. OXR-203 TaxID=3100176 RepID=UPI002AC8D77B|nr:AAA family ATPase [Christiangramia sp. OXR-203]WPY97807.1 AAA family ATPase [Christiangramia sp. OXR-203]